MTFQIRRPLQDWVGVINRLIPELEKLVQVCDAQAPEKNCRSSQAVSPVISYIPVTRLHVPGQPTTMPFYDVETRHSQNDFTRQRLVFNREQIQSEQLSLTPWTPTSHIRPCQKGGIQVANPNAP
jgi:hypothetical protein